jgi:glycosyltransferase involved in cell wall biosynthesis
VRRIAEVLPDDWMIVASLPPERESRNLACIGQVDHPGDWLATADVFLSTASQEGFGYSVAEAMAAGVPVVSSPFGIAADSQLVEQVDSEDPQAWVDAILRAGPKADRAKRYIDEHHSIEAWAAAWQKLLRV